MEEDFIHHLLFCLHSHSDFFMENISDRMNILVIYQYFLEKEGAGGSRFNQFAKYWAETSYEVTVVTGTVDYATGKKNKEYKGKWIIKEKIDENITILRCYVSELYNKNFLGRFLAFFSFVFSSTWAGIFSVDRPNVIIATSPPLFVAIPGYIISRLKRIPFIFEVRDLLPKFAIDTGVLRNKLVIKLALWLEKWIYRKANLINVLTPAFKEYLVEEKGVSENKIIYIPNAADLDLMKPGLKDNWVREKYNWDDKFVILYVGAHGIANDLWQIIDVAKGLKNRDDILFVLIGDGMEKPKLIKKSQEEKLTNIQFMDPIPKNKISDYINAANVCTVILKPIFTTTYPNKVFDYMACAKPIILPIDGACRKLVINEAKAGLFVNPSDAKDFKEKILYLYNHSSELKKIGERGYNFVLRNFDREKLSQKYLEIIQRLINGKNPKNN